MMGKKEGFMRRVIIASHHQFARGLADTLSFLGNDAHVDVICAYSEECSVLERINELFSSFSKQDEVLILTDILQGSVNQMFVPYISDHVFLVAGVNVPLALELCLMKAPLSAADIESCIELAHQSMRLINTYQIDEDENDE